MAEPLQGGRSQSFYTYREVERNENPYGYGRRNVKTETGYDAADDDRQWAGKGLWCLPEKGRKGHAGIAFPFGIHRVCPDGPEDPGFLGETGI